LLGPVIWVTCLAFVVPAAVQYGRQGSPVTRALGEVRTDAAAQPGVAVGMHHPFARPVEADSIAPAVPLPARPRHEWLSLVQRWLAGERGPTWFLADPRRTDLALIDPQSRLVRAEYGWLFSSQILLGGIRPDRLQWIVINEPGWFAEEGWHLTPETAGVAQADGRGLQRGPIVARLKRRDGAVALMIGGRHLGKGAGPTVRVSVRLDGREIEAWSVAPASTSFLKFLSLPAGAVIGDGRFARLEISAVAEGTQAPTDVVAIDQFDAQAPQTAMLGFGEGWQEPEHNPATGLSWRWASRKSVLRTSTMDRDLELQVVGESPLRYFSRPSRVVIMTGEKQVFSLGVANDFAWTARIPASALRASNGTITLETDQAFRPADRGGSADKRELGLRIYYVKIRPVS
jgi:hypothetical protein